MLSFLRFDPNGSWNDPFKMRCVVIEAFRFHPERKNNPQNVKSGSKSIIHLTIFYRMIRKKYVSSFQINR